MAEGELDSAFAVTNVALLPMTGAGLLPHRTVLVRDGRVAAITPASDPVPAGVAVVDGTGRYLMPGLIDMHVHLQPARGGEINRRMLALFLANGVTTVRNMMGSVEILELRDSIERGATRGPWIVTSGPPVDGPDSQWGERAERLLRSEDAARVVAAQRAAGYDLVKVYSRLGRDEYRALLAAGRRQGVPVAGHVPVSATLADALAGGQASIEHLLGYLDAIEAADSPLRKRQGWRYRMRAFDYVDASRMPDVARATREAGVWNCPTLVAMRKWVPADEARRLLQQPEMAFLPPEVIEHWQPWRGFRLEGLAPEDFALFARARLVYRALVRALHGAGAGLVAGTDTPSPLVVPGFSLHEELASLVEAGLAPGDALRAATASAAQCLGRAGDVGTIEVGARADLLLLEANPLEDVANARRIAAVVVHGHLMSRSALQSLLEREAPLLR